MKKDAWELVYQAELLINEAIRTGNLDPSQLTNLVAIKNDIVNFLFGNYGKLGNGETK